MKKKEQYYFGVILFLCGFCFLSCDKENSHDLDIKHEKWDLISIENNGIEIEKENKDYFRDNAYVLSFDTDTTFSLNTGVNYAGGQYVIPNFEKITISTYHEFTEVATIDEHEQQLTNILILLMPEVNGYTVQNKRLTLYADNGKIIFKAQ